MSFDPTKNVNFQKSIIISTGEGSGQTEFGSSGQIRFNQQKLLFEGYHTPQSVDIDGNIWRPLTQDVASTSNLGIIRVGNNLTINPTTGLLSSISTGKSQFYQHILTVSPILGAADYQSINVAISDAIGTAAGGYIDGSITSNIGSSPSATYPFIISVGPGQYSEPLNQIVLPDYVSIRGSENYNTIITQNAGNTSLITGSLLIIGKNSEVSNLVLNLNGTTNSQFTNAIYSANAVVSSNISINNCIFTCNTNINTTNTLSSIYINGGYNHSITNCKFLLNSNNTTGNVTPITITNTTPRIINNLINIQSPLSSHTARYSIIEIIR